MRNAIAALALSLPVSASAANWSLPDAAYSGAEAAVEAFGRGGNDAVISAIEQCHAQISVKTAFNMVTARCLSMDLAGTLMALKIAQDRGVNDIPPFYGKDGSYISRGMSYLLYVPQSELDSIMYVIKESIVEAIPAVDSVLNPHNY